jgi:inner membrane protein
MNAPTHIIGGLVFTGTLCSFTDVNVFENEYYIIACATFAILPDVDTTKSIIGKIFYPVSWLIDRKLGHRTFTHSLLFLVLIWAIFYLLFRFDVIPNTDLLKIAIFATLSHFVFDMITVSGVPLLYPFFPNSCVIPGNVNIRFKSGDWRSEIIVTLICGLLCVSMQPLFANGFWTSYNRAFGTIKHVDRENRNTEFYVMCEYSYILNAETRIGEAIVIDSRQDELILFDQKEVFTLKSDDPQLKVNYTRPKVSTIEKRFEELQFFAISFDSIQHLLKGKLVSGLIQSNYNVRFIDKNVTYHTNFIKFSNRFDFRIYAGIDSSKANMRTGITRLEASIEQTKAKHQTELNKWYDHQKSMKNLDEALKNNKLSFYEQNKLQNELINLRKLKLEKPVYTPPHTQIAELEALKKEMSERNLSFSGYLTILTFGYEPSSLTSGDSPGGAPRRPIYDSQYMFASNTLNSSTSLKSFD